MIPRSLPSEAAIGTSNRKAPSASHKRSRSGSKRSTPPDLSRSIGTGSLAHESSETSAVSPTRGRLLATHGRNAPSLRNSTSISSGCMAARTSSARHEQISRKLPARRLSPRRASWVRGSSRSRRNARSRIERRSPRLRARSHRRAPAAQSASEERVNRTSATVLLRLR